MSIKVDEEIKSLIIIYCPTNLNLINWALNDDGIYFDFTEKNDSIHNGYKSVEQLSNIVLSHFNFVTSTISKYGVDEDDKQIWMLEFQNTVLDDTLDELVDEYHQVNLEFLGMGYMKNGVSFEFEDVNNNYKDAMKSINQLDDLITEKFNFLTSHIIPYPKEDEDEIQIIAIDFYGNE